MNNLETSDLATGWLKEGDVPGRPVDIIMNDDGLLFVGDDGAGEVD
jgi:glucose/arabinose dehydrogenase